MKKFIVVFIGLALTISPLQSNQNAIFKGRPWELLEYYFIIKPNEFTLKKFIIDAIPASAVSAATTYLTYILYRGNYTPKLEAKIEAGLAGLGAFVGTALIAHCIHSYLERPHYCLQFIQEWPHHKSYTPSEFHEHFDELYYHYQQYGVDATLKRMISNTVHVVITAVHHHFPHKYIPTQVHHTGAQLQFHYGRR